MVRFISDSVVFIQRYNILDKVPTFSGKTKRERQSALPKRKGIPVGAEMPLSARDSIARGESYKTLQR
jgi:hypothetical protein